MEARYLHPTRVLVTIYTCFLLGSSNLNRTSIFEQGRKVTFLGLEIGVPTNMFLGNEDVWDGALSCYLLERVLNRRTVVCAGDYQRLRPSTITLACAYQLGQVQ